MHPNVSLAKSESQDTKLINLFRFLFSIRQYSGVSKNFDSGAMAKVSDGYTIGSVAHCIRDVITCKRMLQLRVKPLTHVELINALRFVRRKYILTFQLSAGKQRRNYSLSLIVLLYRFSTKEPVYREEEEAFLSWFVFCLLN